MLENKSKIPITFRLALLYLCVYFMPIDCVILGRKCNTCGLLKQVVCDVQGFAWVSAAESSVCIEPSWFVFKKKNEICCTLENNLCQREKTDTVLSAWDCRCTAPFGPLHPRAFLVCKRVT